MNHTSITSLLESTEELDPAEAASLLSAYSSDTIHDVLAGLSTEKGLLIASHLAGAASREASDTVELAQGVQGTVAELMVPAVGVLPPDAAMPKAVQAALARRHRLYPVADEDDRLLGLVYGWRLFEYIATEISAQSDSMVGVAREERIATPIWEAFRMRHPWLQVNLLTAFCAAFVVGLFENTIAQIVVLAVFLPVLAGQSGNTGCQALAITLRDLTLRRSGADPAMASSIFLTTFTDVLGMGLMLFLATSVLL